MPKRIKNPIPAEHQPSVPDTSTTASDLQVPTTHEGKNPAAVALGKKGGPARTAKFTKEQRSAIAKKAAQARWKKKEA